MFKDLGKQESKSTNKVNFADNLKSRLFSAIENQNFKGFNFGKEKNSSIHHDLDDEIKDDKEYKFDEYKPEDIDEFFELTEEWSDTFLISRKGEIDFVQSASKIYLSYGEILEEDEISDDSEDENEKENRKDKFYQFDLDIGKLNKGHFYEILNLVYNPEKLDSGFYLKYKSHAEYLYKNNLVILNKNFSLIKYVPPYLIFRDIDEEKELVVVMLKNKNDNEKYLLLISYFPIVTFPCVMLYLKEFINLYNKNFELDDMYGRYHF